MVDAEEAVAHEAAHDHGATAALFVGLTVSGLAMEVHGSSRPASGADHQIAHLWEMEDVHHGGERVSHGACVAIGCLDALSLYDWLIEQDFSELDTDAIVAAAPSLDDKRREIRARFTDAAIAERAEAETAAKHLDPSDHRDRIAVIRKAWPALRSRLADHLPRTAAMRAKLEAAGAPTSARAIGIDAIHHRCTIEAARLLRARYTILDLLEEMGHLRPALDALFAGAGHAAGAGPATR